jgi:hypothetical protein
MTPAERCDEIIRMIDEALDVHSIAAVGAAMAGRPHRVLDRPFTPTLPVLTP